MKWSNRLTVIGSRVQVQRFQKSNWDRHLRAQYCDLLECSPERFACQFSTQRFPLEALRRLSRQWSKLVPLLDCESEENRIKGLAKAKAGELEHCEITY